MVMIFSLVVDNLHMGIVFDPRSKALVTGNMPGILQFYMPTTDHHALSVSFLKFLQSWSFHKACYKVSYSKTSIKI